jgi:PIN domain nuclease of toxin-antitoxin system
MNILLDTNAFLWQIGPKNQSKLGQKAQELMNEATIVFVSSVSVVELHIKTMLGKIDMPENITDIIEKAGDIPLEYSPQAADTLRSFPDLVRHDPFDRMLLAQAKREHMLFLTADELLLGLGLSYVVDARK